MSSSTSDPQASTPLPDDFEVQLLKGLIKELLRRVSTPGVAAAMTAAEMQLIRQLCESNSVSFQSIRKGDFGRVAQTVAEEFPFDDEGRVVPLKGAR